MSCSSSELCILWALTAKDGAGAPLKGHTRPSCSQYPAQQPLFSTVTEEYFPYPGLQCITNSELVNS